MLLLAVFVQILKLVSQLCSWYSFNCFYGQCDIYLIIIFIITVDFDNMVMVEVTPLSWRQLSVSLEHPLEESMASVELDLTDPDHIQVKVFTNSSSTGQYSELATKVFQR